MFKTDTLCCKNISNGKVTEAILIAFILILSLLYDFCLFKKNIHYKKMLERSQCHFC